MTANAKPNKNSTQTNLSFWRRHPRRVIGIATAVFLILWLLGVPQHSYYYVRCGGNMPVRYTIDPFPKIGFGGVAPFGYFLPTDARYYDPPYLWTTSFFCTELQAIDAGYEPDPFSDLKQHLPSPSIYRET